jgi:ribonuclease D
MTFSTEISKEELLELPLARFEGDIHIIDDIKDVRKAVKHLREHSILGFDTEKKPTFKKGQYHPTALVQLSDPENAFLFRISHTGFHPILKELLEDISIKKIGLGIKDDLENLHRLSPFAPGGFVELFHITKEMGIRQTGLRNLAAIFLETRISKNQQTSNWENETLTESQAHYAAMDAWVCREIYDMLDIKGYL